MGIVLARRPAEDLREPVLESILRGLEFESAADHVAQSFLKGCGAVLLCSDTVGQNLL